MTTVKSRSAAAGLAAVLFLAAVAVPAVAADKYAPRPNDVIAAYPYAGITVHDESFRKYTLFAADVERLATGFRWVEGPVWFGDGRYLLFSDIPNNQIMRWDEETEKVSVYRKPSAYANGHTRDRQGRLISCLHTRKVVRTEPDGAITVLAETFDGKKFNAPNDVIVKSDDSIWFTDPHFGINGFYEGFKETPEQPEQGLYRIDGKTGEITRLVTGITGPNGLAFSPDEKILYMVGRINNERMILAYDVTADGKGVENQRVFTRTDGAMADGIRVDVDGNLWCGWGGTPETNGVAVFNPAGTMIGHIATPERISNLVFGGEKRNRLFMTGSKSIYSLYVETQGAWPQFEK